MCEKLYLGIFTVELLVKVLAYGFVWHSEAYLRNAWCQLDFVVVSLAWLPIFFPTMGNYSVVRSFRALRPLRALKRIPGMPKLAGFACWKRCPGHNSPRWSGGQACFGLWAWWYEALRRKPRWYGCQLGPCHRLDRLWRQVSCVLSSIPKLSHVAMLCSFILLVFGIVRRAFEPNSTVSCCNPRNPGCTSIFQAGVALFKGRFHYRCALSGTLEDSGEFCSMDGPDTCAAVADGATCAYFDANLSDGPMSFDDIGAASLVIMQCASFDAYTSGIYVLMRHYFSFVWAYYLVIVCICGFFVANLFLAVLLQEFLQAKEVRSRTSLRTAPSLSLREPWGTLHHRRARHRPLPSDSAQTAPGYPYSFARDGCGFAALLFVSPGWLFRSWTTLWLRPSKWRVHGEHKQAEHKERAANKIPKALRSLLSEDFRYQWFPRSVRAHRRTRC